MIKRFLIPAKTVIILWLLLPLLFISCHKSNKLFTILSPSETNVNFENKLENKHLFNILYYLYYYNGGGVSIGDINNDGLPDLYFTANGKGNNKLYLNKGNFKFEDITAKAGVAGTSDWCTGVTMADVNGDGLMDIYVSSVSNRYGLKGHNELFINNGIPPSPPDGGEGRGEAFFTESSAKYGLDVSCFTTQTVFFDYDHDGDLDCFILNQSHHPHANIVDTSNRRKYDTLSGDRLYRNDLNTPAKKFTDVSAQAGIYQSNLGYGLGVAVGDMNNDGWDDIYVGNDFHENDYYYINNGPSPSSRQIGSRGEPARTTVQSGGVTFTESGAKHFNHYSRFSMGNDIADYNNDGQLDVVTADMLPADEKILKTYGSDENPDIYKVKLSIHGYQDQYSKNCLQRNNCNGSSFSEISLLSGMSATDWSWSPLFADFDNDGNKDLFISSGIVKRPVDLDYIRFVSDLKMKKGMDQTDKYDNLAIEKMPDGASHPFLFKGDGKLSFKVVSDAWGTHDMKGYFNGAAYADLDNDGNLDVVINCINAPAVILKNNTFKKNYLEISFKGDGLNTSGIGCKAYVFQKQKLQYQELMFTRGFQSSSDTRLHFGLDSTAGIDSMLIVWPDQRYQLLKNVAANKQLTILQKDASGVFNYEAHFPPTPQFFVNLDSLMNIKWQHKENDFLDYNVQYLIPHSESTRGPKIAVGDVNGDGLDDFYACGAKGQPGGLMIQQSNGRFTYSDTAVFSIDAAYEDVDAIFFDANGDGSPDLYVVSGGNQYAGNNPALSDRLYLNDGKGHFTKSVNSLPAIFENKSCVTVADVDNDGDKDIFIGNLANAQAYGLPQTSFLLINDGKAHFSIANENIIALSKIGIVTCAQFTDVNNDGWKDLVVAGEWMPLTIFINHNCKFEKSEIPNSTGLWQTIFIDDINGDGSMDILAGNWGHNSKLYAGKNGPLKLYIKDFDNNGSVEQVMAYTVDGKEYPFLAKDELERRLPVLKKAYLTYSEVAGKTVQYMFYDLFKDYKELTAEHLGSCAFINYGKGNFTMKDLPEDLQLAPIFSFQKVITAPSGENMYVSGGNFFDVIPYEGRYDAQPMAMFSNDKRNTINYLPQTNLAEIKGQVRDLQWLHTAKYGNVLMVARNNERLLFFGH
jgi:enediyne biosynthesis protein E4